MKDASKEDIIKLIQQYSNNIPLIVLGSGASAAYSIPTMGQLGEHLKKSIGFKHKSDIKQWNEFTSMLDKHNDLEKALLEIQLKENVLNEVILTTWAFINQYDLEVYNKILTGKTEIALTKLIEYYLRTAQKKLTIVTTNYDRIAEYSASLANAFIYSGYTSNIIGTFSTGISKNNLSQLHGFQGLVNIWKVHGSLDWFQSENDENLYLPLSQEIKLNYRPCIVTPGLSKYSQTHLEPYRTIFAESDKDIENANSYLCIGYGFNDEHVHPKLIQQLRNSSKPIVVITKELSNSCKRAIIENGCKKYVLIESNNSKGTRVYSSEFTSPFELNNLELWDLKEFLKILT